MSKSIKTSAAEAVRTRRAYFDCRFGQLHVRTAFPATGGFDEQVTLFCLHTWPGSSREFSRFLPEIADVRSVYAPDLPGFGESDGSPRASASEAAGAISDLATDLRLRQIDILGFQGGATVAVALAGARQELVRRLVLVGLPGADRFASIQQPSLLMRAGTESPDFLIKVKAAFAQGTFVDIADYASDIFEAAPQPLAKQIAVFLAGGA